MINMCNTSIHGSENGKKKKEKREKEKKSPAAVKYIKY